MGRFIYSEDSSPQRVYVLSPRKRYTGFNFLVDCVMTALTSGFWLLWVFAREMRRR